MSTSCSNRVSVEERKVQFILEIFLASCDCFAIKWDQIGKSIANQSLELKNLLKIASINGT